MAGPNKSRRIKPINIWILVYPGFILLDAAGPTQVFSSANDEARERQLIPPYRVKLVSKGGGEVPSSSGISLVSQKAPSSKALQGDTLIVSGGADISNIMLNRSLLNWVKQSSQIVTRCCAVCSGAFLLADTGLLNNRHAVTHWKDVDQLQRDYPAVKLNANAIYLKDGNIYTSAGITAGMDMCLSLVEEDMGRHFSLNVAKRLVMFYKRPGGQKQFSSELLGQFEANDYAGKLAQWLTTRLHKSINVDQMASVLSVSVRSLHRHLQQEANTTPARFLMQLRLEKACRMLEDKQCSIKQIAKKCGFSSEYNMRRLFKSRLGVLPSEYKERFG